MSTVSQVSTLVLAQMPDPGGPLQPPGAGGAMTLFQWVLWGACLLGLVGIVIVGGKMAVDHNRSMGAGEAATNLWKPLAAFVLISNVTGIAGALVTFG